MTSPVPVNPSIHEPIAESAQVLGFRDNARSAGQNLRTVGFQVIAFLLGIALAFM